MGPVVRILDHGAAALAIQGLTRNHAAVLREVVRSLGGGVSITFHDTSSGSDAILTGPRGTLRRLPALLGSQPRIPPDLSRNVQSLLDNYTRRDYKLDCRGRVLDLGRRTHVMGVLNVTPDSFSDGGQYADANKALDHGREMAAQGADIIDIGGESTRPGAEQVSEEVELRRIIPVVERLSAELPVPLSVDTYKSSVARKALEAGASIVNDISGLRFSPDMAKVAADYGAAVVIMHIKGTPRDMQKNPVYTDVVAEVMEYLDEGIGIALKAGVDREKILIDPGIGFGKTVEHNLALINRLGELRVLGRPMVLGTSRKKFIGTILDIPVAEQRVEGTAATVAIGIERGAQVMRVHDVAQMVRVARMTDAIIRTNSKDEI